MFDMMMMMSHQDMLFYWRNGFSGGGESGIVVGIEEVMMRGVK